MDTPGRYESSAGELSSPPSGPLSEPGSPTRRGGPARTKNMANEDAGTIKWDDFRTEEVANGPPKRFGKKGDEWFQLTAAGVPRKKPGRKPGANTNTTVKPKGDGPDQQQEGKARKPRKPRDPNAPPVQRKRKIAPADAGPENSGPSPKIIALGAPNDSPPRQQSIQLGAASPSSMHQYQHQQQPLEHRYPPAVPKRDSYPPSSMQNLLNAEPPSRTQSSGGGSGAPVRSIGQSYDPIRESMGMSTSGSPRAQAQAPNRSPSIASIIEPQGSVLRSPGQSHNGYQHSRLSGNDMSLPASPSHTPRPTSVPPPAPRPAEQETKKDQPPAPPPLPKPVIRESNFTTIANGPVKKVSPKQTSASTPKTDNLDDVTQEGDSRSILDFGRAKPGEEALTPSIVLSIPIRAGETNKYINFMRLAEERFGWDALHPRMAANRDRKARIAAAAASLEKVESGRESGDDMSVDLSDAEASNPENGAASGADGAQVKPTKKKRNFKEDNYDVDDDFVDDSDMMWEAQAAASRDGFFVYSGPLVPEVEKTAKHEGPPKRGRGSRGGRGGGRASTRGGAGTGRGGGPGSRGGSVARKPRVTKSEKAQRDREKAERETMAQLGKSTANGIIPATPALAVTELGA